MSAPTTVPDLARAAATFRNNGGMHRKTGTTLPRHLRTGLFASTLAVACVLGVSACGSGPTPQEQRGDMVALSRAVVETLTDRLALDDVTVGNDGSEEVACDDGGSRYEYAVTASTDKFNSDDEDVTLDGAGTVLLGALDRNVAEVRRLPDVDSNWLDPNWDGTSRIVYSSDDGEWAGMQLAFTLQVGTSGDVDVTITGATTCR